MIDHSGPADQYAALCWRRRGAALDYVLVSSRRTGRWIFPKGGLEDGETGATAARREAWEEAGVVGWPGDAPLGRYAALKVTAEESRMLSIELWPLEIRELAEAYPETGLRHRRLASLNLAVSLIDQDDMRQLLSEFESQLRKVPKGSKSL